MMQKILTSSRFTILIAVIGTFLASLTTLILGGVQSILVIINAFQEGISIKASKGIAVSFIELVDMFLIGIVFYIISLGLYELFIDDSLELPSWLVIRSLDDLKGKLINGMVVVMGVYFLGLLVNWDGQIDLLPLSISITLIIGALTFFQLINIKKSDH
jgi:uncharacterized membrane protein YqhA